MRRLRAWVGILACAAPLAHAKVDPRCEAACVAQGYVQDFCARSCTFDSDKGTAPAFGAPTGPAPSPPPTAPPAPPAATPVPEKKPRPPTAVLEAVSPVRDALRDEVRRLAAENAALRKELAAARKALEDLQRKAR